jgi:hypothetical protein
LNFGRVAFTYRSHTIGANNGTFRQIHTVIIFYYRTIPFVKTK